MIKEIVKFFRPKIFQLILCSLNFVEDIREKLFAPARNIVTLSAIIRCYRATMERAMAAP